METNNNRKGLKQDSWLFQREADGMRLRLWRLGLLSLFCIFFMFVAIPFVGWLIPPKDPAQRWWETRLVYHDHTLVAAQDLKGTQGLSSRLDEIQSLGFGAVAVDVIFPVAIDTDVTDFKDVLHGSLADFEMFSMELRRRDLKLLITLPHVYTSSSHPWFTRSALGLHPCSTFYMWFKTKPKNSKLSFTWHSGKEQYYAWVIAENKPLLNFSSPELLKALEEILNFWIGKGVSGFRFALPPELNVPELQQYVHTAIRSIENLTKAHKEIALLVDRPSNFENKRKNGRIIESRHLLDPNVGLIGRRLKDRIDQHLSHNERNAAWKLFESNSQEMNVNSAMLNAVYSLLLLLPGTVIVNRNIVHNKNDFRSLVKLRQEPAFKWGFLRWCETNDKLVCFVRFASYPYGKLRTKYIILINLSQSSTAIQQLQTFEEFEVIGSTGQVVLINSKKPAKPKEIELAGGLQLAGGDVVVLKVNDIKLTRIEQGMEM